MKKTDSSSQPASQTTQSKKDNIRINSVSLAIAVFLFAVAIGGAALLEIQGVSSGWLIAWSCVFILLGL
jgi:hypothetical protein